MMCRCGSKTTTRHDKQEVIVDLYMYIRHSKLKIVVVYVDEIHVLVRKIFPCLHGIFSKS